MNNRWSHVSFLDALRPEPGWTFEFAILSTYSADLVVVVATMLALSGLDNERGSGSKVDFAEAFEAAKDRLRVLVQGGRISVPNNTAPVLAIMDHFIREIPADEREHSWHPKTALVKYICDEDGGIEWRFWMSSRNLTSSMSQDVGFLMTGKPVIPGAGDTGISNIGRSLAEYAQLPEVDSLVIEKELDAVNWELPKGVELQEILWMTPGAKGRGLHSPQADVRKLVVISPFLDGKTVQELGHWGSAEKTTRILVSTVNELARLSDQAGRPLDAFDNNILYYDAPDIDETAVQAGDSHVASEEQDEDERLDNTGLHAKLIYIQYRNGEELWLGSANATQRGWTKNYEAVARLRGKHDIARGVDEIVDRAKVFDRKEIGKISEPDDAEKKLELLRKEIVASWGLTQRRTSRGPRLVASQLLTIHTDIETEVGLLGCDYVTWPRGGKEVELPPVPKSQETELVRVKLTLGEYVCQWLQRAPLCPPPDQERDQQVLARYLGAKAFLSWIRSLLLEGVVDDGGGDWDKKLPHSHGKYPGKVLAGSAPTLEEILKSWSRDPVNLELVDKKVCSYMNRIEKQDEKLTNTREYAELREFNETWSLIKLELLPNIAT
jgi:hypothetical protein